MSSYETGAELEPGAARHVLEKGTGRVLRMESDNGVDDSVDEAEEWVYGPGGVELAWTRYRHIAGVDTEMLVSRVTELDETGRIVRQTVENNEHGTTRIREFLYDLDCAKEPQAYFTTPERRRLRYPAEYAELIE